MDKQTHQQASPIDERDQTSVVGHNRGRPRPATSAFSSLLTGRSRVRLINSRPGPRSAGTSTSLSLKQTLAKTRIAGIKLVPSLALRPPSTWTQSMTAPRRRPPTRPRCSGRAETGAEVGDVGARGVDKRKAARLGKARRHEKPGGVGAHVRRSGRLELGHGAPSSSEHGTWSTTALPVWRGGANEVVDRIGSNRKHRPSRG